MTAPSGVGLVTFDGAFGRHVAARLDRALSGGADPLRAILVTCPPEAAPSRRLPGLGRLRWLLSARQRTETLAWRFQQEANAEFDRRAGPRPDWPAGCALRTGPPATINDAETVDWMRGHGLRLLVLAGAPILKAPMIGAAAGGALNLHSSLLPHYRGTRAEFWQAHDGALQHAGLTVHEVETGIDSGAIVLQVPQRATSADGPWLMRARNQLAALDALPRAVLQVLSGTATRRVQPSTPGRVYRFADITPEATRKVIARMGRRPNSS